MMPETSLTVGPGRGGYVAGLRVQRRDGDGDRRGGETGAAGSGGGGAGGAVGSGGHHGHGRRGGSDVDRAARRERRDGAAKVGASGGNGTGRRRRRNRRGRDVQSCGLVHVADRRRAPSCCPRRRRHRHLRRHHAPLRRRRTARHQRSERGSGPAVQPRQRGDVAERDPRQSGRRRHPLRGNLHAQERLVGGRRRGRGDAAGHLDEPGHDHRRRRREVRPPTRCSSTTARAR